jgi:hypothetical protein
MSDPSHAAVAAIAALSDAEATQVLYQTTVWLIDAATREIPISAAIMLNLITRFAGQYRGGRRQSP